MEESIKNEPEILEVKIASENEIFWLNFNRSNLQDSIKTLNESAKQIIGINPLLSSLYTIGLGLGKALSISPKKLSEIQSIILIVPIFCWLLSLIAAITSSFPNVHSLPLNKPIEISNFYQKRIRYKYKWLIASYLFLLLSIISLGYCIWGLMLSF